MSSNKLFVINCDDVPDHIVERARDASGKVEVVHLTCATWDEYDGMTRDHTPCTIYGHIPERPTPLEGAVHQ